MHQRLVRLALLLLTLACAQTGAKGAPTIRIATYNLENYLNVESGGRPAKSSAARAGVCQSIAALRPDVVALQEIGTSQDLLELRTRLKNAGIDFPHWEFAEGFDTNIHVAVMSRFPFVSRHSHTNENFLLGGRRFRVSRGFGEVDFQVNETAFTLITAHLKSRRPVPQADEAELREQEAMLLREKIDARLSRDPRARLVVLGDFNDVKDSKSTRIIIGRGRNKLIDTRPSERNGDDGFSDNPRLDPRTVTWTHYFGKEDSYSRIDYILLSPAMARIWIPSETYVLARPNWGTASDHRPVVAAFAIGN